MIPKIKIFERKAEDGYAWPEKVEKFENRVNEFLKTHGIVNIHFPAKDVVCVYYEEDEV